MVTAVVENRGELDDLANAAETLAREIGADSPGLSSQARRIADRLSERRFDVAVVGEFNRGKSTILNMLLRRVVLPSGALPVTSIITEVSYGPEALAKVVYEDGTDQLIDLTQLDKYVSEEQNPGNVQKIATAQVVLPSAVLRHGAILVDTPGVGSIFRHNTDLAREMVVRADGAVMVMSADTPITDAERSLIRLLSQRSQQTFFVLNRIDHVDRNELSRVQWFVETVLEEACGEPQILYSVSAKTGEGFETFASAVERFLATDLEVAVRRLARHDLDTLLGKIENECAVEESAMSMSFSELQDRVDQFRRATDWQHEALADDVILFEHAGQRAISEVSARIEPAKKPDRQTIERIHEAVASVGAAELEVAVDHAIEAEVKSLLEPIRRREELEVERAWRKAADRFERATQRRADRLRELAGELFQVDLHALRPAEPAAQRGRFFYSAPIRNEPPVTGLRKMLRPLMPERRSRERLLEAGDSRLVDELRIHVERLESDLVQRIHDANREFQAAMESQVNEVAHAMLTAIQRAQAACTSAEFDHRHERERLQRLARASNGARSRIG